ncbi:YceI family protein [Pseudomonas silvicola]|nr:YceI family protein [Pseudomonas silvicola]
MSLRSLIGTVLLSTALFSHSGRLQAAEYTTVNSAASTLSFTFNQMGSRVYGTFARFVGTLDFDTAHPDTAHAALTIELNSIDVGGDDANRQLQTPAWFDTANYPVATFESRRVEDLGEQRYRITGNLTLRGITREVSVPVLLKSEGGIGIFDGELVVKRSAFSIGVGEWADTVVSDDIEIRFRMVAPQH